MLVSFQVFFLCFCFIFLVFVLCFCFFGCWVLDFVVGLLAWPFLGARCLLCKRSALRLIALIAKP